MNIKVIGSTKVGFSLPKEEAVELSGKAANVCYMRKAVDKIMEEPAEKSIERASLNIASGHHSVFGHATYTLVLEHIPKILAMILNNEKVYNTSEKSARYTHMKPSPQEKELYEKWIQKFSACIQESYPSFDEKMVEKLAMENARYLISVFTPATTMMYTVNFGQLNYIIHWAKDYIASPRLDSFSMKVKEVLKDFVEALPNLEIEGLDSSMKHRSFSLFATRERKEEFGENYSVNYMTTFAGLAQAQRHRTLSYEMRLSNKPIFFVPPIINTNQMLRQDWLEDIESLKDLYPQGMLVEVNERGTIENFILKCTERLCGQAQWEIMTQTNKTMQCYLDATKDETVLHDYLLSYSHGPRCTFPGWKCNKPCVFGPKHAFDRII